MHKEVVILVAEDDEGHAELIRKAIKRRLDAGCYIRR